MVICMDCVVTKSWAIIELIESVEGWQFVFKIMFISTEQNNRNRENVCLLMSNIRWDEISRATDTQQAFDTFHKHLIEMYNKHFPKIRIKRKYKNKKPGCLKV